jgi:(5R)-carbapenem-3-carboxylate synthase
LMPCDTSYYLKNEPKWYHFPGTQCRGVKEYINGGLHYHHDERPSYKIRIADIPEETSYDYYNIIEKIYHDDSMTYYHHWEAGDLLLMDNVRTMHGRQAFSGKRSIAQFQVRNK